MAAVEAEEVVEEEAVAVAVVQVSPLASPHDVVSNLQRQRVIHIDLSFRPTKRDLLVWCLELPWRSWQLPKKNNIFFT